MKKNKLIKDNELELLNQIEIWKMAGNTDRPTYEYLADKLGVTKQRIWQLIDALRKKGILEVTYKVNSRVLEDLIKKQKEIFQKYSK